MDIQTDASSGSVRLNKLLADHGIASRRKADEMIAEGEVMIDGQIVTELGTRVDPEAQRVEVDGVVLRPKGVFHRYYLLNKPSGVLCTTDERETRRRAIDLISDRKKGRIYTVGRLDEETSGLVLLTNDGDFANHIAHPRYGIPKTYRVTVPGRISEQALRSLRQGVHLAEFRSSFDDLRVQKRSDRQSTLFVTLHEGRNREIRRAFAKVGLNVRRLHRARIGGLTDRGLKIGNWRPLLRAEVQALLTLAAGGDGDAPVARSRPSRGGRRPRATQGRPQRRS